MTKAVPVFAWLSSPLMAMGHAGASKFGSTALMALNYRARLGVDAGNVQFLREDGFQE